MVLGATNHISRARKISQKCCCGRGLGTDYAKKKLTALFQLDLGPRLRKGRMSKIIEEGRVMGRASEKKKDMVG